VVGKLFRRFFDFLQFLTAISCENCGAI